MANHYQNVFKEGTQAQNIGQGQDFPTLGGPAPAQQTAQYAPAQQTAQQQQPVQPAIDPQAAFQVFWSMMDENARNMYMQSSQDQQSASYGQWFNQYTVYMQQQYYQQQAQAQQQQQNVFQQVNTVQAAQPEPVQKDDGALAGLAATSTEFVPQGHFRPTDDQFPDLDSAFTPTSKPKKGKETKQTVNTPTEEDLLTPHKGKASSFFVLDSSKQPNSKQMAFIYEFYPEYGSESDYTTFFKWLHDQSSSAEASDKITNAAYGRPQRGGRHGQNAQSYDDEDSDPEDFSLGSGFGQHKGGQNKKKVLRQEQKVKTEKNTEKVKGKTFKDPTKIAASLEESKASKQKQVKYIKVEADENEITEVDESREPVSLVFIGHVDAGKSTICGNLMLKMGVVDQQIIEKYKQEAKKLGRDSWWLAYVMDNSEEEKAKGKTVEMGRAFFNTQTKACTVFDAPGHKNYVPNMIMGATLADFGGLVISARKGEFEAGFERDGQTREHVHLAKSLGIQKLIVVVNKMDEGSVKWSSKRYNEIKAGVGPFLIQTGFKEEDIYWVPISGLSGDNIVEKVNSEVCDWYQGPTLIELIDTLPLDPRDPNAPLRLPVLDKMTDAGQKVILGKIEQGTIRLGDKCIIAPVENPCQIGKIYNSQDKQVRYARPGENVKLKLLHIENDSAVSKGDVLCHQDQVVPTAEIIEAEIELLELLSYKPVFTRGYTAIFHMHTLAEDCSIKDIMSAEEQDSMDQWIKKEKPKFVRSFAKAKVRISFKAPISVEKYSSLAALGQFTLRDEGKTIALGKIMRYKPAAGAAARAAQLAKKLAGTSVNATESKAGDIVFDMETGTTMKAAAQMEAIAE